jgi:hypothetical protein
MKAVVALAALLVGSNSSLALTSSEAAKNLLYFEYARQGAEFCEKKGVASQSAYARWREAHEKLYRISNATIRAEAEKRGVPASEQDGLISETTEFRRKSVQENISKKGMPCTKFNVWIDGLSAFLQQ